MTKDYAYDHGWAEERIRLAGLETALDPGTRSHMTRLGVGPGTRCLEIGAGGLRNPHPKRVAYGCVKTSFSQEGRCIGTKSCAGTGVGINAGTTAFGFR